MDNQFGHFDEDTKEVINLEDLTDEALNNLQSNMDQNMEESDLQFQDEVERLVLPDDTVILEPEKKKKKKFDFKEKWSKLSKQKKIIIIVSLVLVLVLGGVGTFFLVRKPKTVISDIPDVIVEEDNYRYENGVLTFLDDEEELGSYECENKDENKCYVAYYNNDDEIDDIKKVDEDGIEIKVRSKIYKDRFVFIFDNKSEKDEIVKLYDISDSKVIDSYLQLKTYDVLEDGLVLKNTDNLYGLVTFDRENVNEQVPFEYDSMSLFSNDKDLDFISVSKDGSYYLIDDNNSTKSKAVNDSIVGANAKAFKTRNSLGEYIVYDYNNKNIGSGDYALLLDNYVVFARDLKLYVTDYNKNAMNMDGINLKNDNYNAVATYKNKKLVSTKMAFEANLYDKDLIFTIYGSDTNDYESVPLNLQEGIISSSMAYLSYFSGKIYIYQDEEKNTLLGTYVCNNKNVVDNSSVAFNQCTVAKESSFVQTKGNEKEKDVSDSLGILPIFFDRYVFLKDGDNSIVLYDLKESSTKAWYTGVDAGQYSKLDKLAHVNDGPIYYVAQSDRTGSYGLAKITKDNVEVQIAFENKNIKKLGDYLAVEKDDGNYLVDIGGKVLTNSIAGEIVDYKNDHLKYIKDNQYYMAGFKENGDQNGYVYIELYEDYYAAVYNDEDSKKLRIFAYGDEEPLIDNVTLVLDSYINTSVKAFEVSYDKNYIYVKIGQKNGNYTTEKFDIKAQQNALKACRKIKDVYYGINGEVLKTQEEYIKNCNCKEEDGKYYKNNHTISKEMYETECKTTELSSNTNEEDRES